MPHMPQMNGKFLMLGFEHRLHDRDDIFQCFRQRERLIVQRHPAAFNAAHIEDVVDQSQ